MTSLGVLLLGEDRAAAAPVAAAADGSRREPLAVEMQPLLLLELALLLRVRVLVRRPLSSAGDLPSSEWSLLAGLAAADSAPAGRV